MSTNMVTHDPAVMGGQAVVAGTRIPTWRIAETFVAGEDVRECYPELDWLQIHAALAFEMGDVSHFTPYVWTASA